MIRVTPGWMVRVCPLGTVRLAVAMYGLQVLLHVPETFPDTKQVPWVKHGVVASAAPSAEKRMDERRGLGFSLRPRDVVFRIVFPVGWFAATLDPLYSEGAEAQLSAEDLIVKTKTRGIAHLGPIACSR